MLICCRMHICNRFKKTSDRQKCLHVNICFIGMNVDPVNQRAPSSQYVCRRSHNNKQNRVCVSFQSRILTSPRHPSIFLPPFCNWCWNDVINDVWKYPHAALHQQSEGLSDVLHTHLWAVFTSGKLAINLFISQHLYKEHNISPIQPLVMSGHTLCAPVVLKMLLLCW